MRHRSLCYLLRHMRHQEHMQAVGTHCGPTRIIGPTGHAIGGTAQHSGDHLKLPTSPCHATISDYYGPGGAAGGWTSPPPPPASARLARVCCGPEGAAGGRGLERPRGKRTERPRDPPGAGRRVSPMHGTRSCLQVDEAQAWYIFESV